jgi:hypothetical protein
VQRTGAIRIGGEAYFISEALADEDVACVPLANRILVIYRHMYVRELHPRQRQSVPLMQPVEGAWPMTAVQCVSYVLTSRVVLTMSCSSSQQLTAGPSTAT